MSRFHHSRRRGLLRDLYRNDEGFSFFELLAVVLMLAALVTMAVPSVRKAMSWGNLNNGARTVISDLRTAQQTAIQKALKVQVRFTVVAGQPGYYEFYEENPVTHLMVASGKRVDLEQASRLESANFGAGGATVEFDALGGATNAGTVTLANPTGEQLKIEVVAVTGRARIRK
ncbi:MAG TPA: GspH/FimT family pseudopilin [Bacillota bacterium]|jgi:type II secretory pathway pseudopilin PulG